MYEGYTYIPADEPTNLGTKLVKSTFRVSSKDDTIIHCYKGTVINYIKVLLGNSIDYSIGDYTDTKGNKCGVLAAKSSNGKAYVLSLRDEK